MVMVRLMAKLLQDRNVGDRIVPDEARTFGMESLFRQFGIYSHVGRLYTQVDRESLLYYREATDGVITEEGITEAGCMSSFITAGTSYAYEIAVIVREGMRRMYVERENVFYYITVMNELYPMPGMPKGSEEGILRGMYRFKKSGKKARVHLMGSGAILNEAVKAADILSDFHVPADVWSVTSYKALYTDAVDTERHNRLHPGKKKSRTCPSAWNGPRGCSWRPPTT